MTLFSGLLLLLAFFVSAAVCAGLLSDKSPLHILDYPNERSLHQQAIARTGGIAILTAIFIAWGMQIVFGNNSLPLSIPLATLLLGAVSLMDDRHNLSAALRFAIQIMLVIGLLMDQVAVTFNGLSLLLSGFALLWMINLYNFMDGMDGFAAGMSISGFGFMGWAGWIAGQEDFALVCWIIGSANLGFLLFNYPPARIFMGDSGSTTLGLLASALGLWGINQAFFPWWLPLMVFAPFIADASVTIARRLLRGEKIWQAHRSHYYQRLVQKGWGHRNTVLLEYVLMLACGSAAILLLLNPAWVAAGLVFCVLLFLLLGWFIDQYYGVF
ncbi:MAG: glycosyltransferase family 4 protein [gamma proteobacterium symbiont of Bathyaustriella thionipta]|nr:glycosyltransferase family 4 protein [gamma proteobacterium symbiont of Bathyaustriella thionipta]